MSSMLDGLKFIDDEMNQLRTTRDEALNRADGLDWMVSHTKIRDKKRAIAMSVLTHGVMLPVGVALVAGVEDLGQEGKDRELERKQMRLDHE